jgi:hypothetical protein
MATMDAIAARVVSKRIKNRWWLLSSDKKTYSLAAKASTQNRKSKTYFAFMNDPVLKISPQYRKFKYKNEAI